MFKGSIWKLIDAQNANGMHFRFWASGVKDNRFIIETVNTETKEIRKQVLKTSFSDAFKRYLALHSGTIH